MKYIILFLVAASTVGQSYAQAQWSPDDSLSYALGQDLGAYMKRMDIPVNKEHLIKAISDVLDDQKTVFESEEKDQIIRTGMQRIQEERNASLKQAAEDFMQANLSNPDIRSTPEGVQYEVLQKGSGEKANLSDTVVVHYIGKLASGETFDNSYDRGDPLSLTMETVIEGWKIGIPLMELGSKYRFFIPYNLGYGTRGSGPIPPYSALIFEVELLNIKKAENQSEENAI